MDNRNPKEAARSFTAAFAAAISAAVAQASGSPWQLELTEQSDPPAGEARRTPRVSARATRAG